MQHYTRRMVTIVTEAALERALVAELEALGVQRLHDHRCARQGQPRHAPVGLGAGRQHPRRGDLRPGARRPHRQRACASKFYDHYAMILFLQDVSVLRSDKF